MSILTKQFEIFAGGTTFKEISLQNFNNFKLPLPPLDEQKAIANFLDDKCGKIDGIISECKKQLEILKDYKKSLITETVTKGLNPAAEMKDSGIKWIGEIPAHWKISKLKYVAKICNGQDFKDIEGFESDFPVYGSGGIFAYAQKPIYIGESVLFGRKGVIDNPIYVNGAFWTVDTAYYTKISDTLFPKYFFYFCTNIPFKYFQSGSALPSMTASDLMTIKIPVPPLDEQKAIANFLDDKCGKIDELIEQKQNQVKIMNEYKKSVIYEYVTGKKIMKEH